MTKPKRAEKEDIKKQSDENQPLLEANSERTSSEVSSGPPLMVVSEISTSDEGTNSGSKKGEKTDDEEALAEDSVFIEEEPSSWKKIFNQKTILIALIVILVLGFIGGGIYVYQKAMNKKAASSSDSGMTKVGADGGMSPSPEEEIPTPTSSSTPELKREDLKIQVLNGSGIAGTAGKAKEFLEGLGYKEVEAGNADSYDYQETGVSIKEGKKEYWGFLTDDLSKKYTLSDETKTLSQDSRFDAVVIVGKK